MYNEKMHKYIFLAPTGELYELLCHRKKEEKKKESTNGPFLE